MKTALLYGIAGVLCVWFAALFAWITIAALFRF